ncbi:NADP-binding protein [Dacryopinax primogenitus]|uniref:Probable quinone oxidoreductase n=1 Tax=Dacryopinax primogenitus (strain DJM 731) TaxID=1858805 RepID=M5GA64_DACPD|nr:NADP-binding protein [Dacryopinax primogenitus]EJU02837.1 NADP-binding protein [Dacryopinax primogenitus]
MSLPKTTKAILVQKTGGPEVLALGEVATPTPSADKVLVKVEWAGVNYVDTYKRAGVYTLPLPLVLGEECSGTIVALPTSESVLNSEQYALRNFHVGDRVACTVSGSFAQYAAASWEKCWKLPVNVETKIGALCVLQGLTALTMIRETYTVKKGDYVLVHAAAGGVGLLLCQACSYLGAHVIGTVSTLAKAQLARENGAEHVIISKEQNVIQEVMKLTDGKGCHVILDGIGKDTWEDDFEMIRRKGTIVTYGNASGVVPPFAPLKLAGKNIKVARPTLGNYIVTAEESAEYFSWLFELIDKGVLKFHVHDEYPFTADGVRKSQTDITSRGTTGKLVIKVE